MSDSVESSLTVPLKHSKKKVYFYALPVQPILLTGRIGAPGASIPRLEFILVRRTPEEALFNRLGHERPIGERLKYPVKASSCQGSQVLALLAWQSATPRPRLPGIPTVALRKIRSK